MRVVHTISGIEPESGGPTSALCGLARAQVRAGHAVEIVATWKFASSFALADALRADGLEVTLIGPTRRPFRRHRDLVPALRRAIGQADVVHVHAMWEAIEHHTAAVARRLARPYVWTPHGMLDAWNMRRSRGLKNLCMALYLRRDLNAAAALHVATAFEAGSTGRLGLRPPLFVQGFGLDAALLHANVPPGRFRARHELSDRPLILFLGRIQRGKGLETLVPAVALMKTPATLIIAGPDEGNFRRHIEALIAVHRLTDRVRFVGMLGGDEKLQALTDADVLAAPSAHENFGIAVAEAIALGTAVVVSDQVGLAGLIAEHDLGRVTPLDPAATAAALEAVLSGGGGRRERAREIARTRFDWPTIAHAWTDLYRTL